MASGDLYVGNDTIVELTGLTNSATGATVNSASASITLVDENDAPVDGMTFPQAMTALGNGAYSATLQDTLDLTPGLNYRLYVDVNAGSGLAASFALVLRARERI